MKKSSITLVCLFLLSCGRTPKPNNESYLSDSVAHKIEESEEFVELESVNAPTRNIIQHDITEVRHTYTPPHVKGNKNFNGECDLYSTATLKISDDQTKLYIELYLKVKEPHLDNTEVSGKETFVIYDTKNTSKKIRKILTGTMDSGKFIYGDDKGLHLIFEPYTVYAEWDMINGIPGGGGKALRLKQKGLANFTKDFTKKGLVKKWVFEGNLNSNFDASSQPRVNIETNTISILVKEN